MKNQFEKFEQKYGFAVSEEIITRIIEKAYYSENYLDDQGSDKDIRITNIYKHNVLNITISGTILYDCVDYGFIINDGDCNGTEIVEWGISDDIGTYVPEKLSEIIVAPFDYPLTVVNDPARFVRYLEARNTPEIKELIFNYQHDKFFSPSISTTNYWTKKAKDMGMYFFEKIPEISTLEERNIIFEYMCDNNLRQRAEKNVGIILNVSKHVRNQDHITAISSDNWKIFIGRYQSKVIEEYRFEGNTKQFKKDVIALKMVI